MRRRTSELQRRFNNKIIQALEHSWQNPGISDPKVFREDLKRVCVNSLLTEKEFEHCWAKSIRDANEYLKEISIEKATFTPDAN